MESGKKKSGRPSKSSEKAFTEIFRRLIGEATQQEAAEKIGVTRQNVGRWLAGMNTPDIEALEKIADAYEVSTDYLLGRTSVKNPSVDIRMMCDYWMLDEKTTEAIRRFALEYENAQGEFGTVIRSKWFDSFMKNINDLAIAMWQKDFALQEERKVDPSKPEEIQNAQFRTNDAQNRVDLIEFRIIKSIYSFFAEYEKKIGEYMGFEAINEPKGDPTHADHNPTEE